MGDADGLPSNVVDARTLGAKFYFTGKPCKHGHKSKRRTSTGVCMECKREESNGEENKKRRRDKRIENREDYRKKKREYYKRNREKELARDRERYAKNRERKIAYQREYYLKNRESVLESKREYHSERMGVCEIYTLSKRIRSLVGASLRGGKSSKTENIIGCTMPEFKNHIERQFTKGMNWSNRDQWHIDHIVPLSSAKTKEEVIELNHYTNLRPLWAKENLSKGASQEFLI